jgi:hypothetical protein
MPRNRFSLPSRRKISYLAWLFFSTDDLYDRARIASPTDVDPWFEDTDEQTFRPWLGDMPVAGLTPL